MSNRLYGVDVLSVAELDREQVQQVLTMATAFKYGPPNKLLENKIVAHCFFELSTRTRLSFEAATLGLGAQVVGFNGDAYTSIKKGESFSDTIKIIAHYADLLIIRHPREGAARLAAELVDQPVINAGDAANQHPTQALIDLFSMQECQTQLDGLNIALVGDLKYSRAIHSLVQACALFSMRLFLVSPLPLSLPEQLCDYLKHHGIRFSFHPTLDEIIARVDILYMTRWQQERFKSADYELIKHPFVLTPELLLKAAGHLKVLHPLPRLQEIDVAVDQTPYAYYFNQAANGLYVRKACLALLLQKEAWHS